jgi:chromosome segregation ATPase
MRVGSEPARAQGRRGHLKREIERLRQELAERERRIAEQAKRIADLERQLALRRQNSTTDQSCRTMPINLNE